MDGTQFWWLLRFPAKKNTCLNICNTMYLFHVCSPLPYNICSNICMWSNAMGVSRNIRLFLSPLKLLLFPLLLAISNSFWERKLNNIFVTVGGAKSFIPKLGHQGTVCWIEVKVAVLCARQYMPWNLLLIKVLNSFWYFKHQISTRIGSKAYLKHNWRNCLC